MKCLPAEIKQMLEPSLKKYIDYKKEKWQQVGQKRSETATETLHVSAVIQHYLSFCCASLFHSRLLDVR